MKTLKIDDLETSKDLDNASLESISGGNGPTSSSTGLDLIKQFGPNVSAGAFGGCSPDGASIRFQGSREHRPRPLKSGNTLNH